MRCMLKASLPVEVSNAKFADGSMGKTVQAIVAEQKPEAAYFFAENGKRTAMLFIDLADTSQIPAFAEPWFLAFNAAVEIVPVMNAQDLGKGLAGIEAVVKKYT